MAHPRSLVTGMRPRFAAAVLSLLALLPSAAIALDHISFGDPIFSTVGDGQSIPGQIVSALAQDRAGYLWIGTHEGIIRHDGYEFRLFRYDANDETSLSDNVIRALAPGEDGRLWVATNNGGVSIFDPASETFRRLPIDSGENSLASGDARAFAATKRGMWIGTRSALHFVDYSTHSVKRVDAAPRGSTDKRRQSIGALYLDGDDNLWIGSASGLAVRRPSGEIETVSDPWFGESRPVNRILQAKNGRLWLSTFGGGLAMFDPRARTLAPLSEKRSYSLAQPTPSQIWVGVQGGGIEARDAGSGQLLRTFHHDPAIPDSLDSDRIGTMMVDRAGVLWVGLWGRGLNRHLPDSGFRVLSHSPTRPDSLTHPDVGCILETSAGEVWIGTRGNGVDVFSRGGKLLRGLRPTSDSSGLDDGEVPAMLQTADGRIWIGTTSSFHEYDPVTERMKRHPLAPLGRPLGAVATLAAADDGCVWVGTTGGLALLDRRSSTVSMAHYDDGEPVSSGISEIAYDRDGNVWVATQSGLAVRPKGDRAFIRFSRDRNTDRTLSSNSVIGLLVTRKGEVWVGTAAGLDRLVRFDRSRAIFEAVAPKLGREGKRGENLVEDANGRIWVDGETMFDPVSLARYDFTPAEGGGRVIWRGAARRMLSGEILFGGPDGVLVADPRHAARWNFTPPVVLSALRVDGVTRLPATRDRLHITPGVKGFAAEFSSLDLSAPEQNRYSYRLLGYDAHWSETDARRRTAAYTAIPPGDYVLEVRGTNRAAMWSPDVLRLPITVDPAFHQTIWFRAIALLFCAALIFGAFRARVRQLEARKEELEGLVSARTAELDLAARTDFLTGLSNRRDLLAHAAEVEAGGGDYVVVLGDIDHFKKLNDEAGHNAGDAALRHVADCIRGAVRRTDVAARWGGEEFLILMPGADEETAAGIAERLRETLESSPWTWEGGGRFTTMTLGVAANVPGGAFDAVVRRADEALYGAKRSGRNRVFRAGRLAAEGSSG
jgi:diguanylate cyclase (GGDEF)-like protein